MIRVKKVLALVMALVLLIVAAGCASTKGETGQKASATNQEVPKIGLITGLGGLGDESFNDLAYAGTKMFADGTVQVDVVEPKQQSDIQTLQQQFAEAGDYSAIICVGYEHAESLAEIAANFPDQKFVLIDSTVDNENVASVTVKNQENAFQIGALAALVAKQNSLPGMSGDNHIGVVAGMDNPLLRTFVAGYMCGAKYVDADITVDVSYVGSFTDPQTAKELAMSMYNNGADIVWQAAGSSGLGVFEAAKEAGRYALGCDGNQNALGADNIIASSVRRVDKSVYELCQAAIDGTFEGGVHLYGASEGAVEITTEGSNAKLDSSITDTVDKLTEKMASGELVVPSTTEEVDAFIEQYGHHQS
ncbi:MAG: BMP family ABC transporter substrate-binding protein [Oscillospiraceae bacterium]|nr:BMP family ABC transporter substrate-binding protein [Oscillospiraceae bacterium]